MVPACGDGTSTMALAVSTLTSTWSASTASPTLMCHSTISASGRPSPRSGSLKFFMVGLLERDHLFNGSYNVFHLGQVILLVTVVRHHRVVAGYPHHRRLQVQKGSFGNGSGYLRTHSAISAGFMDNHRPAGFGDRAQQGFPVQQADGGYIDHLATHALLCQFIGRLQGFHHAGTPGDQGHVIAFSQ